MLDRLLILVPGFPADEHDTSCLPSVQTFVRVYAETHPEVDVRVVAFQYPFRLEPYTWHGLSIRPLGGANRGGLHKPLTWRRAWHEIALFESPIIHSFWVGECALIGALAARKFNRAHVTTIGGQELRRPTTYSRLLRRERLHLTAGSGQAAATARNALGQPVARVIPLGLDLRDLAECERRRNPRDIDVLFVGSLTPNKRIVDLLAVAQSFPAARFVVAGDGPLRATAERSAPPNVGFLGHLPRDKVLRLMARSKILLHPAAYESQGYVFLEALASGMYVICRDVGAPGDSHKVFRTASVGAMKTAVERLLRGDEDFQPVDVPTAAETVRQYDRFYRRVLQGSAVNPIS